MPKLKVEISNDLDKKIESGRTVMLGALFYEPDSNRLHVVGAEPYSTTEAFAILDLFGIHRAES